MKRAIDCAMCGERFIPSRPSGRYCSKKCRQRFHTKNPGGGVKCGCQKCFECGEKYEQKAPNQKYCSQKCCKEAQKKRTVGDQFVIFNRDGLRCQYCGASPAESDIRLVPDHIIPHSAGGLDTADNLVTSCYRCNSSKANRSLTKESFRLIKMIVNGRNGSQGIHPKKGIKGSHCRGRVRGYED